jgi:hypothetical protein
MLGEESSDEEEGDNPKEKNDNHALHFDSDEDKEGSELINLDGSQQRDRTNTAAE